MNGSEICGGSLPVGATRIQIVVLWLPQFFSVPSCAPSLVAIKYLSCPVPPVGVTVAVLGDYARSIGLKLELF